MMLRRLAHSSSYRNGCSGVGRISIGFLSDYIGRFNLISLAVRPARTCL